MPPTLSAHNGPMLAALSPARRRLALALLTLLAFAVVSIGAVVAVSTTGRSGTAPAAVNENYAGPVLLIPGYGGSRSGLLQLAQRLQRAGRQAQVMTLPGDGTGDLRTQARAVQSAAAALKAATKSESIDVIGYSAGGIVARLWAADDGGNKIARRILTLGSPHHGTELATLGALFPSACPIACQELAPGSSLLTTLDTASVAGSPSFVSVWSSTDDVVVPPASAVLAGATNVSVQSICPSSRVSHSELPTDATVAGIVLAELAPGVPPSLNTSDCPRLGG